MAGDQALQIRRQGELEKYSEALRSEYALVNESLRDSLDYEDEDIDLEALRSDSRVIVEIKGGEAVTVGELTVRLGKKFFHGFKAAAEQKRVNEEIPGMLDHLILERATRIESQRLGIEERPEFRRRALTLEERVLFGVFVSKVITANLEISDDELRAHYEDHRSDYTTPEMMNIDGLGFRRRGDAEVALEKLRQGADLQWMRGNATGQVDPETDSSALRFEGRWMAVPALPEEVRQAVAGAAPGDFRFFEAVNGYAYVLLVRAIEAPGIREYEQVRDSILEQVGNRKRQEALDSWLLAAREASDIEIVLDGDDLKRRLGLKEREEEA